MSIIIAGHFARGQQVRDTLDELARREFQPGEYATYFIRPQGGAVLAELGSYLFGGEARPVPDHELPPGPMVAICVDRPGTEAAAILILSRCGAREIERAEGTWQNGEWRDFDPRGPHEILKEIPLEDRLPPDPVGGKEG